MNTLFKVRQPAPSLNWPTHLTTAQKSPATRHRRRIDPSINPTRSSTFALSTSSTLPIPIRTARRYRRLCITGPMCANVVPRGCKSTAERTSAQPTKVGVCKSVTYSSRSSRSVQKQQFHPAARALELVNEQQFNESHAISP